MLVKCMSNAGAMKQVSSTELCENNGLLFPQI